MKHDGTSPEVFEEVIDFAKEIGMVPIPLHKEQPGYVLNTLLVPHLKASIQLVVDDVTDPKAEYLDKGKMGKANGEGVYMYPNPAYENPDFLKAEYQKEPQLH